LSSTKELHGENGSRYNFSYSFLFMDSEAARKIAEDTTSLLGSCYRVIPAVLPWLMKNNIVSQCKAGTIFMYEPISGLHGYIYFYMLPSS